MEAVLEVFLDALKDCAVAFPFVFLMYFVIEIIETANQKEKIERALSSKYAPAIASLTGIVPECGFSITCAKLYSGGFIRTGTLVAAFVATSDEGIIVLMSSGAPFFTVLALVGIKAVYGATVGIILNFVFKNLDGKHVCSEKNRCTECGECAESKIDRFLIHPLLHSLKTLAFVFVFNLLIGGMMELVGEEKISEFIGSNKYLQPLLCALIGLIPNCASSIAVSSAYCSNIIGFSGLLAGLCSNAGVGTLILFKDKATRKKSGLILLLTFISGIFAGYCTVILGF